MKAKEYFHKYHEGLVVEAALGQTKTLFDFLQEMNNETAELLEKRHCKRDTASIAVIKEQNQKWNKVAQMIKNADNSECLKPDGYLRFWASKIPKLKMMVEMEKQVKEYQAQLHLEGEV